MNTLHREKLEQAVGYLQESGTDLWLIFSSEGSDPAVKLVTGLKTVGRTFFLIGKDGRKTAVCSIIDAQESENSGLFDEVIKYDNTNVRQVLREVVERLQPGRIALNYSTGDHLCDGLTTGRYRWLRETLGPELSGRFCSSEGFLGRLRAVKTPAEIARIRKAIDITLEIYDAIFAQLRVGLSERDVGQLFIEEMKRHGVVEGTSKKLTMPLVMKERIAHRDPGPAVIAPGDFLIMDFGVEYEGYVSDIARTVYFLREGETHAPAQMEESFQAAYEAISLAKDAVKPGVRGIDIDTVAREHLLQKGMPEITHATGHQIGRSTHDGGTMLAPAWERYGSAPYGVLEENMCFTLEPTILREEGYSVLMEENILVTRDGAEFLSRRPQRLLCIASR